MPLCPTAFVGHKLGAVVCSGVPWSCVVWCGLQSLVSCMTRLHSTAFKWHSICHALLDRPVTPSSTAPQDIAITLANPPATHRTSGPDARLQVGAAQLRSLSAPQPRLHAWTGLCPEPEPEPAANAKGAAP